MTDSIMGHHEGVAKTPDAGRRTPDAGRRTPDAGRRTPVMQNQTQRPGKH
ncbi:hypothetical protein [Alcanivorax sp. 24]|nr:hypothetical protein [Alcanivorax sp. 24]